MKTPDSPLSLTSWLDRALAVAWFVAWIGLFVVIAAPLAAFITTADGLSGFVPPVEIYAPGTPGSSELSMEIGVRSEGFEEAALSVTQGMIHHRPGSWCTWALLVVPAVAFVGLWLLILHRLRGFVATLRGGRPFVAENGRRLRTIGLAVLGSWVVTIASGAATHVYARHHFVLEKGSIGLGIDPHWSTLFVGVTLLIIADVFRIGASLQEDHDATI